MPSGMVGETRLLAMTSLILADKLIDNKNPNDSQLNITEIRDFVDWFSKITTRMNKVAKLLENKNISPAMRFVCEPCDFLIRSIWIPPKNGSTSIIMCHNVIIYE